MRHQQIRLKKKGRNLSPFHLIINYSSIHLIKNGSKSKLSETTLIAPPKSTHHSHATDHRNQINTRKRSSEDK